VWSVRNSAFDPSVDHWAARMAHRAEDWLARSPAAIIANSSAGREFAAGRGFPEDRIRVVPNGIDTERFRPDPRVRAELRRSLGLGDDEIAVGVLARLNATKGYPTFIRAAASAARTLPKLRFLCVGGGGELPALQLLAGQMGVADQVTFAGELDANAALNAFDVACSPSVTEGFSNAIAEAMACGLPCVVTDVGDSAAIVGEHGIVVPPESPDALATAIVTAARALPNHDPAAARRRIVENYSVDAMVERTLDVFRSVLRGSAELG
jgi:glycosyltransferase involved in cell wall biosynthesis